MAKLLVDTPSGEQQLLDVGEGGGYFDPSRVLWDERADGPLPEITLGGMVRQGSFLVFSAQRKAQHDSVTAPTESDYEIAVQGWLDTAAQAKGYDNIVSACSYAGASNPFQAEAQAFLAWRGNVWATCYEILAQVQAGEIPAPTLQELFDQLPAAPQ